MKVLRRMIGNSVISMVGQIITWVSTLTLMICYGRFLGDVKFGELYTALTFALLIGFPIDAGFTQQVIRAVAQDPLQARRYLSNTLLIKLLCWPIVYALILLLSWLLGYSVEVRILMAICGLSLLSSAVGNTFSSLHYAFERTIFPVVGSILEKGISAAIGWYVLKQGAGVQVMALVLLAGSCINTLWQGISLYRRLGFTIAIDKELIRHILRTCVPFLIYGVLGIIYYRIDAIMLSLMTSVAVVGWYGAGYRLFDTLTFLSGIIMTVTYPVLIKLASGSDDGLKIGIEKTMNTILFCSLPIAAFLFFAASYIVGYLYHSREFVQTVPALQGLAPGLVFLYVNALLSNTIATLKKEKKIPFIALIALIFNFGLNLLLIPLYRHVGAAILTSLTELLIVCLQLTFIPRHLLPFRSLIVGLKALVACGAMGGAIWLINKSNVLLQLPITPSLNVFVVLAVAISVYLATALLLRTIPRDDILAFYNALRRKTGSTVEQPAIKDEKVYG
ncbi:polysaccharide biosynthesis protein [Reticulibacter mediterranei]|uniref:Polysaccharide biosynthesis protein n=2 Tax=Reticulibacter mediterranei TaxID=2778369 RepID=A0A8J3N4B1_9CHLR|nr:polysaccharide biosynthesis protein [Reticulibacter mediterranei]